MPRPAPTPIQKARRINLDRAKYGAFAEIGAGQEIARWFFLAGRASGTVAKSMSAYDMEVSDAIYGPSGRYVSRERLLQMLDQEFDLLVARLGPSRGKRSTFFAVADTISTGNKRRGVSGRGWIGVRFQHTPGAKPSQIILHTRMHESDIARQQEAVGLLGVNLVYGIFYLRHRPRALLDSLVDNLTLDRLEINMVKFSGPAFAGVDDRLMSLHAINEGFTRSAIFAPDGHAVQAGEVLFGRPLLVLRGSFRPITKPVLDMIQQAHDSGLFKAGSPAVELCELSLRDVRSGRVAPGGDFLLRMDMLHAVGQAVMLSRTGPYYLLPAFFRRHTSERIVFLLGLPNLQEIFDPGYYTRLPGGLLEGLGQLFMGDVKLAVYPAWNEKLGRYVGLEEFRPPASCRLLFDQLVAGGRIVELAPRHKHGTAPLPKDVLKMIKTGDPEWTKLVPRPVARLIKKHAAFGLRK